MTVEPFIRFKDVKKIYRVGSVDIEALHDVSFEVEKGEICIIVGASGAGKTTLLNILGGMDALTSGEVWLDGKNIAGYSDKELTTYRRYDIGFVFQFYNLIPDLTVEENIEVVSDISAYPLDIDEVLQALDIEKYRRRFPKELSGGQQQRVAIARAMIKNPKLLLCDELTGALDTKSSGQVLKFVEKMNRQFGTTVVIITHNEAIAGMADQVIRLKDGQVSENLQNKRKIPAAELVL